MIHAKPRLTDTAFVSYDGTELPLKIWLPAHAPKAVFIALHGFNDYSNFIKDAAFFWNEHDIAILAYDQRGFGGTANRGGWSGYETMCLDLRTFISLVQDRYPDVPLFLLGDSMGGAVIMAARQLGGPLPGNGVVLVAPAVWSRQTMPFYQRWALWLGARILPGMRFTGESLDITPSDNREMLKAMSRDPLIIKKSRVDTLYGLTNLMDTAYNAAPDFTQKSLFLYGAHDEIIPAGPMADVFRQRLAAWPSGQQRFIIYNNGYHMLLKDLQAEVVWQDILSWLNNPSGLLPSVRENAAHEITRKEDIAAFLKPDAGK